MRTFYRVFLGATAVILVASYASTVSGSDLEDILREAQRGFVYSGLPEMVQERTNIEKVLADALPRFPVGSMNGGLTWQMEPCTGVTWNLDQRSGVPVLTSESYGPLYAERAQTLGKGRVFVSFSYNRIEYDELDGKNIDGLNEIPSVRWDWGEDTWLEADAKYGLDITSNVFTMQATYGVTDRWDIGILLPYIRHRISVDAEEIIRWRDRYAETPPDVPNHEISNVNDINNEAGGVGDIVVRSKYLLRACQLVDISVGLDVRTPTGDEESWLGTGDVGIKPYLILSNAFGRFEPHLNIGHEWNTTHSNRNSIRYAGGLDVKVHDRVTVAGDVIGMSLYNGHNEDVDIIDGNVGVKVNVARDILLTASAFIPINNDGLRADVIGTVGLECAF